jgi:hypothetical protein
VCLLSLTCIAQVQHGIDGIGISRDKVLPLFFSITPIQIAHVPVVCRRLNFPKVTQQRAGNTQSPNRPRPAAPNGACHLFSPRPGHLSDSSRGPPAKDPAHASTHPCAKAVQTQQPCSVRASLSTDICSGLASDGGGAHGQGDFQLACLRACASHVGPQWCPRSTPEYVEGARAAAKAAEQLCLKKKKKERKNF